MAFFYGRWRPDAPAQGRPVKITSNRIKPENPGNLATRYRVIHEGPNYVLIVERYDPPDVEYPTKFVILTTERRGFMGRPQDYLLRHPCGYGTWGTKEAFDWPVEKLIETFRSSMCFQNLDLSDPTGIGWGSTRSKRLSEN